VKRLRGGSKPQPRRITTEGTETLEQQSRNQEVKSKKAKVKRQKRSNLARLRCSFSVIILNAIQHENNCRIMRSAGTRRLV
jgi:hypothetical protein